MPVPHQQAPVLTNKSTFTDVKGWVDFHVPGDGDKFIAWVQMEGNKLHYGPLDVNKSTYGPPPSNKAVGWLGGWLLLGPEGLGVEIGRAIGTEITGGAQDIPKALQGAGQGIGTLSPNQLWAGFLSQLTSRSTLTRIAEGIIGIGLVIIAVSKLGGNSKAGQTATRVGKAVKIL